MQALLKKYGIELTENENLIFRKALQKRNEIIHGKKVTEPTKQEYNILSKIIYFVIRNALIDYLK